MDTTEDKTLVPMSYEDYEAYLIDLLGEITEEAKKTEELLVRITEMGRGVAKKLLELDPDILDKLEKEDATLLDESTEEDVEDN